MADSWAQAIRSNPAIVVRAIHGEKGGAETEATCLIRPDYHGLARPARFPKFESREIRGEQSNLSDGKHPPHRHSKLYHESSLDKN